MAELQRPLQVSNNHQQNGTQQSVGHRSLAARAGQTHQVVDKAEGCGCSQGGDQGDRQVVADAGSDAGELGQQRHGEMTEIVIADGMASQPRVLRGEMPGLQHSVQKGEVHRLFGVVYLRSAGYYAQPQQEKRQKDNLGNYDCAVFGDQETP